MRLSDQQVDVIRTYINKSGIHLQSLQEDVLDHLCCVLEENDTVNENFEKNLRAAIDDLAPEGLSKLETETVFLLSSKKLLNMRKFMYAVGLGSSIALTMGLCFRLLQWPGGWELMTYGFIVFSLLFLPMTIIDKFKLKIQKSLSERLRFILGAISAIVAGIAVLLKILHLQGGDLMLLIAAGLFAFGFLPFLFFTNYRKAIEQHL